MNFGAADERGHTAGSASTTSGSSTSAWWETWHLDVASENGVGLAVRLACAPGLGIAWWWTHLLLPDHPGPIVVRDHEVGLPRQGLEIRADGLWAELTCETPFEHWTYGLEAFGVRLDEPADSLRGEIGERIPVGFDLEWEVDASHELHAHGPERVPGYEQLGVVHGEVLVGRSRIEIDAIGLRSHAWGVPRSDRPTVSAWARGGHSSLSFDAIDGEATRGYITRDGVTESISSVRTETHRGADGLPTAARYVLDDQVEIDVVMRGLAVVPIVGPTGEPAVFTRSLCSYEGLGQSLIGWSTWLDPG